MKKITVLSLITLSFISNAQMIINAYAKASAINGTATTFTVTNVNEVSHTFTVGGNVMVVQIQDDVIGTNTTNVVSFGDLSGIANAGKYEIGTIASRSPATGTPTLITLSSPLTNVFNTGSNSSVQIVTFRNLGYNYTTTSNIIGLPWDGNIGGVVAFEVTNILTLNHSISADAIGFRGGAVSANADEPCNNSYFRGNDVNKGFKGEGIYKTTDPTFTNGIAKILSGGGGENNTGGGGGANYTSGGNGGLGWLCTSANSGRGFGGIALSTFISGTRLFMGGGGGGGQQNNNVGTNGGNGGGIIFIKANTLTTNTVCTSSISISANGQSVTPSGNDGGGRGGAAGSIILQINTFSTSTTCPLSISSNGGNGGTVNDANAHGGGGGGGGGQGLVIFSVNQPIVNVNTTTTNGLAGWDNSSGSVVTGTSGGGSNNSGILFSTVSLLPIE